MCNIIPTDFMAKSGLECSDISFVNEGAHNLVVVAKKPIFGWKCTIDPASLSKFHAINGSEIISVPKTSFQCALSNIKVPAGSPILIDRDYTAIGTDGGVANNTSKARSTRSLRTNYAFFPQQIGNDESNISKTLSLSHCRIPAEEDHSFFHVVSNCAVSFDTNSKFLPKPKYNSRTLSFFLSKEDALRK